MRAVIISAAPNCDTEGLAEECAGAFVICADGGLSYAQLCGVIPDLIVGDFDSYQGEVPCEIERVTLNTRKDFSDTLHAVFEALDRGYDDITLMCALGGRLDHALANISALRYIDEQGAVGKIVSASEEVYFTSSRIEIPGAKGRTFSVFPFSFDSAVVSYLSDVEYKAEMLRLFKSRAMGLSNISNSDVLKIEVSEGDAVILLDK